MKCSVCGPLFPGTGLCNMFSERCVCMHTAFDRQAWTFRTASLVVSEVDRRPLRIGRKGMGYCENIIATIGGRDEGMGKYWAWSDVLRSEFGSRL
jgi:hypothetical protein